MVTETAEVDGRPSGTPPDDIKVVIEFARAYADRVTVA